MHQSAAREIDPRCRRTSPGLRIILSLMRPFIRDRITSVVRCVASLHDARTQFISVQALHAFSYVFSSCVCALMRSSYAWMTHGTTPPVRRRGRTAKTPVQPVSISRAYCYVLVRLHRNSKTVKNYLLFGALAMMLYGTYRQRTDTEPRARRA